MKFLIILILLPISGILHAQDPHFSQFYSSPLTLNPAFTGKFDGTVRIAGNYRNQWPTINNAFVTETASVDFHILQNKLQDYDVWGLGFMALSDKSADGAVSLNYFSASTAFHKALDEDGFTQLGFGFQGTYSNMNINTSKLTFEDELTPLGFTGVTSESFHNLTLTQSYLDLNAGILFSKSTTDDNNFYAGVSVYHINRPEQALINGDKQGAYTIYPRATFHAGAYFPVGDISTLNVSGLYSTQAGAHETLLGGAMEFNALNKDQDDEVNFYVGAWLRFGDAIIPYVGLDYSSLRIGLSYDVNTSSLSTASNSRGGIELSIIYIVRKAEGKGVPCPKF